MMIKNKVFCQVEKRREKISANPSFPQMLRMLWVGSEVENQSKWSDFILDFHLSVYGLEKSKQCTLCLKAENKTTHTLNKKQSMTFITLKFQTTNENWTPSILNEAAKIIYKVMLFGIGFFPTQVQLILDSSNLGFYITIGKVVCFVYFPGFPNFAVCSNRSRAQITGFL